MRIKKGISNLISKEMWKRILFIARKEFKYNFKNVWIVLLAVTFLGLSILVSFYGTAVDASESWRDLQNTVLYMTTYIEYMVPILGLVLGYGSIVREREEGSIELLLSYPLERGEVISGKFLGLWGVLSICVVSGMGLGGIVIGTMVKDVVWAHYYLFILSSVILGGIYISISMMLSVIFEDSTSTMSASIFVLFLFSFLWLFGMYALAEFSFGWKLVEAGTPPRWYFGMQLFNPILIWYTLLALNIPPLRAWAMEFGGREPQTHPGYYDTWIMVILMIIWISVPLILSEFIFKRKEIG